MPNLAAGLGFPDALRPLPFGGINFSSYPVIQRAALAAGLGFEPRRAAPKTAVLPLDDPAIESPLYLRLMVADFFSERVASLARTLGGAGVAAFFAHHPVSMAYLAGFGEDAHERFLTLAISREGKVAVICPSLSASQARRVGLTDIRPWSDGEDPIALYRTLLAEWSLTDASLAVDDTLPAHALLRMQEASPNSKYLAGGSLLGQLMRQKSSSEISTLRRAGAIADEAYVAILPQIHPGMTERALARIIESEMESRGGIPTFCIVGAGANGAEPHHLTDDTVIQKGDVIILDFGCALDGYQSDITRTVAVGEPDPEAKSVYEIVFAAHQAARVAIAKGAPASAIDAAARKVIETAGYGPQFMHRTGHGIGMNGHEPPYISQDNHESLQVGNCFSIEPGVYLPGRFGIRIENIVVCSDAGHESLNAEPFPQLEILSV